MAMSGTPEYVVRASIHNMSRRAYKLGNEGSFSHLRFEVRIPPVNEGDEITYRPMLANEQVPWADVYVHPVWFEEPTEQRAKKGERIAPEGGAPPSLGSGWIPGVCKIPCFNESDGSPCIWSMDFLIAKGYRAKRTGDTFVVENNLFELRVLREKHNPAIERVIAELGNSDALHIVVIALSLV